MNSGGREMPVGLFEIKGSRLAACWEVGNLHLQSINVHISRRWREAVLTSDNAELSKVIMGEWFLLFGKPFSGRIFRSTNEIGHFEIDRFAISTESFFGTIFTHAGNMRFRLRHSSNDPNPERNLIFDDKACEVLFKLDSDERLLFTVTAVWLTAFFPNFA